MSVFLGYIFLGLSLSAPIGPINASQLDKGIRNGFLHSWLVGVGAMAADALYMILVYLGLIHFLHTPFMQTFLWLFGCFVLIYTGVESILGAGKLNMRSGSSEASVWTSFVSGFFMSLSNPLTVLFWLGIYGSVLAETASTYGPQELVLYSLAILLGITIWDLSMAGIASSFRRFASSRILVFISIISGLSLIGFGVFFGIQAFQVLMSRL